MVQTSVRQYLEPGYPGMPADSRFVLDETYINSSANVAQVSTITLTTSANGVYTVNFTNNIGTATYTYNLTGADDNARALALRAAIIGTPQLNSKVLTTVATNVVTLTSRIAGDAFTLAVTGTGAVAATPTANGVTGVIPYGVCVMTNPIYKIARLPQAGDTVANLGGVTLFSHAETNLLANGALMTIPPKGIMSVRARGRVWVSVGNGCDPTQPVQIRLTASTDGTAQPGTFSGTNAASAGGTRLSLAGYARWTDTVVGKGIARVSFRE